MKTEQLSRRVAGNTRANGRAQWLRGRALYLRRKGRGFEPPQCQVKNQIKQTNKMKAGKYKGEGVKGT